MTGNVRAALHPARTVPPIGIAGRGVHDPDRGFTGLPVRQIDRERPIGRSVSSPGVLFVSGEYSTGIIRPTLAALARAVAGIAVAAIPLRRRDA